MRQRNKIRNTMRKNGKNSTALFDLIHLTRTWVMAANCVLNSTRERAYAKEKRKSHENDKRKNDQQKQNVRFYAPNTQARTYFMYCY